MPYTTLISTEALARERTPAWAVVDCRFDLRDDHWGQAEYRRGHVPGAVYASLNDDLAGDRSGTNGRHPVPAIDALAAAFGRLGITRETQVVAYDQDAGLFASRLWWSLRYLGHDAVALLDGGWAKWAQEGRPAQTGDDVPAAAVFTPAPRRGMRLDVDDVVHLLRDDQTRLVDARGPERFEGREEPLDRVAGHIPGAVNHYYKTNLADDGTMRPVEELRALYAQVLGGRRPEQAVMYCGSGVSACHNLLAMEHAGLRGARLYPGSWSEWSSDPARPIETGPGREPSAR